LAIAGVQNLLGLASIAHFGGLRVKALDLGGEDAHPVVRGVREFMARAFEGPAQG
jgi:hypothetical protein